MLCLECEEEMEGVDTTISNIDTEKAKFGQKTGDIYWCEQCEEYYLYNYLNKRLRHWVY